MLVQEQDQVQRPIYFVRKALQDSESRYLFLPVGPGTSFCATLPVCYGHPISVICKHLQRSEQMGALVAVCTRTLKSANKKHQNSTPSCRSTVKGTLKVEMNCILCTVSGSGKQSFSSPLCVAPRLQQTTRVCSGENLPKIRSPLRTFENPFNATLH